MLKIPFNTLELQTLESAMRLLVSFDNWIIDAAHDQSDAPALDALLRDSRTAYTALDRIHTAANGHTEKERKTMNDQKPIEESFPKYQVWTTHQNEQLLTMSWVLKEIIDNLEKLIVEGTPSKSTHLRLIRHYAHARATLDALNILTGHFAAGEMYIIDGAKPYEETVTKFENKES